MLCVGVVLYLSCFAYSLSPYVDLAVFVLLVLERPFLVQLGKKLRAACIGFGLRLVVYPSMQAPWNDNE